jgi:hypothetical protein
MVMPIGNLGESTDSFPVLPIAQGGQATGKNDRLVS